MQRCANFAWMDGNNKIWDYSNAQSANLKTNQELSIQPSDLHMIVFLSLVRSKDALKLTNKWISKNTRSIHVKLLQVPKNVLLNVEAIYNLIKMVEYIFSTAKIYKLNVFSAQQKSKEVKSLMQNTQNLSRKFNFNLDLKLMPRINL